MTRFAVFVVTAAVLALGAVGIAASTDDDQPRPGPAGGDIVRTPVLSESQRNQAREIARGDDSLRLLFDHLGEPVTVGAWHRADLSLIGAAMTFARGEPADFESITLPDLQYDADADSYETFDIVYRTITDLASVTVLVDLGTGRVVAVKPKRFGEIEVDPGTEFPPPPGGGLG